MATFPGIDTAASAAHTMYTIHANITRNKKKRITNNGKQHPRADEIGASSASMLLSGSRAKWIVELEQAIQAAHPRVIILSDSSGIALR